MPDPKAPKVKKRLLSCVVGASALVLIPIVVTQALATDPWEASPVRMREAD